MSIVSRGTVKDMTSRLSDESTLETTIAWLGVSKSNVLKCGDRMKTLRSGCETEEVTWV